MEIANIMCSKKDAILIFYSEVSSSLIPVVGTPESEVETYKRRVRGGGRRVESNFLKWAFRGIDMGSPLPLHHLLWCDNRWGGGNLPLFYLIF